MIKKIYLTRSQTRAMSADHPIGDPTGGPAFGEKNDPISAAISIGTMFTAAEAGFAAMTLMQGITFAGAAISLVGNVTGNKSLMKIGAVAGIAGGLGSLAESAGWFDSGNLQESLGMKSGITDEMLKSGAPSVVPGTQVSVVDGAQVTAPGANTLGVDGLVTPEVNINAPGASGINAGPSNLAAPAVTTPAAQLPASTSPNPFTSQTSTGLNVLPSDPLAVKGPGLLESVKAGNYMDAAKAAGSGAMDLLKNNPTGAYVAAQAIGGVADWLSGKTDAELDALKANTGYANAKAMEVQAALDREKLRRANLNAGYTNVNAGFKVNPNAAVTQPWQQPGLVAGAMQQRPA